MQRPRVLVFLVRVRIADNFFDLSVPLYDSGLQSLDQVLVLTIAVRKIFLRDVEFSVAFELEASFSDRCHKFVELGQELFFYIIGPRSFSHYCWNESVVHKWHQTFQMIFLDFSHQDFGLDLQLGHRFLWDLEDNCGINTDFMRDVSCIFYGLSFHPNKKSKTPLFQQTQSFHFFFESTRPMLYCVEHSNWIFNSLLDPFEQVGVDSVIFEQFRWGVFNGVFRNELFLPFVRDRVVESFPAFDQVGLIFLLLGLHRLDQLLVFFFRNVLKLILLLPERDRPLYGQFCRWIRFLHDLKLYKMIDQPKFNLNLTHSLYIMPYTSWYIS